MKNRFTLADQWINPEFQSSITRFAIVVVAAVHILISRILGHLAVDFEYYLWMFGFFFVVFCGILISVLIRPVWSARRFVTLAIDIRDMEKKN